MFLGLEIHAWNPRYVGTSLQPFIERDIEAISPIPWPVPCNCWVQQTPVQGVRQEHEKGAACAIQAPAGRRHRVQDDHAIVTFRAICDAALQVGMLTTHMRAHGAGHPSRGGCARHFAPLQYGLCLTRQRMSVKRTCINVHRFKHCRVDLFVQHVPLVAVHGDALLHSQHARNPCPSWQLLKHVCSSQSRSD